MPDPRGLKHAESRVATSPAPHRETSATTTDAGPPPAAVTLASTVGGTTSLLIGGVYLGAWLTGAAPGWAAAGVLTMKTNMALALVLASAALLLLNSRRATARWRAAAIVAAAIVLVIGVLSLAQHLFSVDLGIDQLIATEPPGAPATVSPNRIGPPGSLSLALLGSGLLALAWRRRIAVHLGLTTCLIVLVPAIGFLYGIGPFYGTAHLTGIAWPTVTALCFLASGLVLAASRPGIVLWRNDPGGVLLRRLALPAVLIPLVLGYVMVQGDRDDLYDTGTGTGLFALSLILVFSMLLWRSATQLSATAALAKRAADALQEREERLRPFVEHAPAAVAMFDREMRYVAASRRFASDYGIASHHLEGRSHYDVFPELSARWKEIYRQCLSGAVEKCDEEALPRADGTIDWMRWEIHPWRTATGEIGGITQFSEVITERKRVEELRASEAALREARERELTAERAVREASETWAAQLAQSNEQLSIKAVASQEASEREARARAEAERREQELEAVFSSMRDGVIVYGEDGRIQQTNEAATAFFGSDLRGLTLAELIQRFDIRSLEEGAAAGEPVLEDHLPGRRASRGEVVTGERVRVRAQSGVRSLLVSASPLYRDASGQSALTVFRDVTDFERAAESARRAAEQIRLSHDAIFVWHLRNGIESWNRGAEDLYGFGSDEVRGRSPDALLHTRFPRPWADIERELDLRRRWEGELAQTTQDGRTVIVSAKLQLIRHDDGVERVVEVNRDITDRRRAEDALRESEQRLREADRRKDEFLAVLSHELRNPLAPIRNSLYVLDRAAPGGEQARHAKEIIERQVNQLTRLVADLLDVSRISRGKVQLQRERIDLREVIRRTLEDHRSLYVARGLELRDEPGPPVWVDGDAARLAQVLTNLLNNAAKFTKEGGTVAVILRQEGTTAVLEVRDTGAGIAPELLARMFEPFIQGEQSLARAAGGLGLGLALVKGIVELHGGTVAARSDGVGRGAVLTIRIPAEARPALSPRPTLKLVEPRARRVLVIEDNVDAAESLKEVLEFQEHEVAVAFSGPEGLDKARTFAPDLVLCDIGLPGMDGYEVARALRSDDRLHDVPLVAMTGYALAEDQKKAAEAGFDRHLAKPADFAALERIFAELQGRRAG